MIRAENSLKNLQCKARPKESYPAWRPALHMVELRNEQSCFILFSFFISNSTPMKGNLFFTCAILIFYMRAGSL